MGVESIRQGTKDSLFETKPMYKSSMADATNFAFTQQKSSSEVVYSKSKNNNNNADDFPKQKVKAKTVVDFTSPVAPSAPQQYYQQQYQQPPLPQFQNQYNNNNESYHYNIQPYNINNNNNQLSSRFVSKSPLSASQRALSDVTYRPHDTRTELTNRSDPGPYGYNLQQQHQYQNQSFNHGNENYYYPNQNLQQQQQQPFSYGEARPHKPKIATNALTDFDKSYNNNNGVQSKTTATTIVKPRKVTISAQLNKSINFADQNYSDSRNDDDSYYGEEGEEQEDEDEAYYNDDDEEEEGEEENSDDNEEDNYKAELEELKSLSSDPRVQRMFLDLQISNKSLLGLNATLESKVKQQSDKLATIPSFEAMMDTQKKQFEHLNKVEDLINTLSTKMNEQDNEIKVIKSQITEKSDEKEKARVTLFYDPKALPLKSLPHIIFDRAYDDITILFTVVTSLIYTVYIFPVIVIAKTATQLADKSREKIQEITISS